jgi:O-antigen/teichoic acid export membrane protein
VAGSLVRAPRAGWSGQDRREPHGMNGRRNGKPATPTHTEHGSDGLTRKQIRGSGLLLSGRGLSTALKFIAEIFVVRYLATAEYGAWTYALSAVVLLKGFATLGLNRAVARYVPIHLERGEREEFFGVSAFVFGSLLLTGAAVVTAFYAFPDWIARLAGAGPGQSLDVLFIMVFLVPVQALDDFLTGVCAAFGNSGVIFVRRYVLNPGLRLIISVSLVLMKADVRVLAYGWLLSNAAGIAYYGWSVWGEMRKRGLVDARVSGDLRLPVRRVLSYTLPVMVADWCNALMLTAAPLLLGYFADLKQVALFQVVIPLVSLNKVVSQSFAVLFEPAASRLRARGDVEGLDRLYWRAAVWVAVLSFPAFAVSFVASGPLVAILFGARYASAAPILSLLVFGTFVDAILGFNDAVLRVVGQVGWLLGVTVVAATLNVTLNLILIPRMGAIGAGLATGIAWLAYALLKQVALSVGAGVRGFHPAYARVYAVMALTTAGMVVLRVGVPDARWLVLPAAVVSALVVLLLARRTLSVGETFPELARWPRLMRLLG